MKKRKLVSLVRGENRKENLKKALALINEKSLPALWF